MKKFLLILAIAIAIPISISWGQTIQSGKTFALDRKSVV